MATHSLFLLRELEILLGGLEGPPFSRYFRFHAEGVDVGADGTLDDIEIDALDAELEQSDRYLMVDR